MGPFKKNIQEYLENRAQSDSLFAEKFANPKKNIDECLSYIISEARKQGGTAVCVADDVVYGWAVHYYDEENIKVKPARLTEVRMNEKSPAKLTASEKKRIMAEAEMEYREECIAKLRASSTKKRTRSKSKEQEVVVPTLFAL